LLIQPVPIPTISRHARASGTNDKAGTWLNLECWVSPRSIKETYLPPTNNRYPFMGET